jgi:hypothetical protein
MLISIPVRHSSRLFFPVFREDTLRWQVLVELRTSIGYTLFERRRYESRRSLGASEELDVPVFHLAGQLSRAE